MLPTGSIQRPGWATRLAQNLGAHDARNMVWSWGEPLNFGDWIGPLIYEVRQGRPPLYHRLTRWTRGGALVTVGSIMPHIRRAGAATVWGAGIIYRNDDFAQPREIRAVRGPLTRARCPELGYPCPDVYGDPAILLPQLLGAPEVEVRHKIGVKPHFKNWDEARALYGDRADLVLIDVRHPVHEVVAAIRACRATVSSSLHGPIVSHTYGVPSAWVRFGVDPKGDGIKFRDYYAAGGIDEIARPPRLRGGEEAAALAALARSAPLPASDRLRQRLIDACPF